MKQSEQPTVAIIGGGITGLSAAWAIQQHAPHVALVVFEAAERWGGKVLTQTIPGPNGGQSIIDAGPESFVTRKREIWDLVCELGLEDRVIDPGGEASGTYVLTAGRPLRLPLDPISFVRSPLLSARGKLRLLQEPFIRPKTDDGDESLADFVTRRLGAEALEKFIGPVLGGIYNTNPETQSILVTSPVMRQMEAEHGSLVAATVARLRAAKQPTANSNPPPARFIGFRTGAEELIDALVDQLDADLQLNAAVRAVEPNGAKWDVVTAAGRLTVDAVIVTTPANSAAKLLAGSAPEAAGLLAEIRHNSIGTISLAYRTSELQLDEPIRGLMIPRREGRRIDAVVYTSAKIPERAPAGTSLLRVFYGGGDPTTATMPEAELVRVVRAELAELLGLTAEPLDYRLARWSDSYAQADVGHLERVAAIESSLPPGLFVAGGSYRGLAVPDCVRQGRSAAAQALASLAHTPQNHILNEVEVS